MESTGLLQDVASGAQVEVVCVSQNYLCTNIITQFGLMYCFNCSGGAHRHENRRLDVAMVGVDYTGASVAAGSFEVEGQHVYCSKRVCKNTKKIPKGRKMSKNLRTFG